MEPDHKQSRGVSPQWSFANDQEMSFRKLNILKIARHHRGTCDGEACDISLMDLAETARLAGIRWADEELKEFM